MLLVHITFLNIFRLRTQLCTYCWLDGLSSLSHILRHGKWPHWGNNWHGKKSPVRERTLEESSHRYSSTMKAAFHHFCAPFKQVTQSYLERRRYTVAWVTGAKDPRVGWDDAYHCPLEAWRTCIRLFWRTDCNMAKNTWERLENLISMSSACLWIK